MGTLVRLVRLSGRLSGRGRARPPLRGVGLIALTAVLANGVPAMPADGVARAVPTYLRSPAQVEAAADRDMIVRIHLACLWEITAAAFAQQRAGSAAVQTLATTIHDENIQLDQETQTVATQLGIALPGQPNDQQQGWLNQLSTVSGNAFDMLFVSLLRQAHGAIFPIIAGVRAGTENAMVRQLADDAVTMTMNHMRLLEGSNLVDYSSLTPAPRPALDRVPFSQRPLPDVLFVWLVIAVGVLSGGISVTRIIRPQ